MRRLLLAVGAVMLLFAATGAQESDYSKLFQKDFDRLQGDWEVTAFVIGGEDVLKAKGDRQKVLVNFLRMHVSLPNDERIYSFNLDPTRTPKHIDLLGQVEPGKQQTFFVHGIYELKEDTLKLCVPINDDTSKRALRPKKFSSPKGSDSGLIIMKRSKP